MEPPAAALEKPAQRDEDGPSSENEEESGGGQKKPPKIDRGVFVMCSTTKEHRASSEALALLNNYADLWEEEKSGGTKAEKPGGDDLLDELRKEVAGLRGPKRRFEPRQTKVKGVLLYIYRGPWEKEGPDPVEFVLWLANRMKEANEYGRFIARIIPLQVCGAAHQLMRNVAPLIAAKFPKSDPSSFEIEYACRNNSSYNRRDVQVQLIGMGLGYPHFVSHTMPQKTILVEIANKIAGVSVVPRYYTLSRFNIQQRLPKEQAKKQGSTAETTSAGAQEATQPAAAPAAPTTTADAPSKAGTEAVVPKVGDETSKQPSQ